ncbi:hypothetical protein GYMLUDRAFT_69936 [Collybiopsis luxurians FD-317 M1]|nr:hypothetical protein GYMLUDRAFT_69936 [Collybiopsis luxurians FD-317 M1]
MSVRKRGTNGEDHEKNDPAKLKVDLAQKFQPLPALLTLKFGKIHTGHMLIASFNPETGWGDPEIKPYAKVELDPMSSALQYATNCFEGLSLPSMNMSCLVSSIHCLSLPPFSTSALLTLIKKLIVIKKQWISSESGYSLYVCPTVIGTSSTLGIAASNSALLYIICSPSGPYLPLSHRLDPPNRYIKPINLLVVSSHVCTWPGGTGEHKLSPNSSPGFLPMLYATEKGWDQILWLRDNMDINFLSHLSGTILPSITCTSLMDIAKAHTSSLTSSFTPSTSLNSLTFCLHISEDPLALTILTRANLSKLSEGKIALPVYEKGIGPIASALRERILDIQAGRVSFTGFTIEESRQGVSWSIECV